MAKALEQVPAKPFCEWLEARYEYYAQQVRAISLGDNSMAGNDMIGMGPARRLAEECGWEGEAGVRKLYRLRNEKRSGSKKGRKCEYPTSTYPRETVEEALHSADADFATLYTGYAERLEGTCAPARDVLLFMRTFELLAEELVEPAEPVEAWCARCHEATLRDRVGECQWCAGEREFMAKLARRAAERLSRERHAERKQAA